MPAEAELVEQLLPLVGDILRRLCYHLPRYVDMPALYSAGMFGLVKAIRAYTPERSATFRGYCATKIRGAMIDELRATDTLSKWQRVAHKKLEQATTALAAELGREPTTRELAVRIGKTTRSLARIKMRSSPVQLVRFNPAIDVPAAENDPAQLQLDALDPALAALPYMEARVIREMYFDGRAQNAIAADLHVTPARVSQIHSTALARLRLALTAAIRAA